jgi:peptidyl-prolyl cis-trans isomerase A (cyclophilin A)
MPALLAGFFLGGAAMTSESANGEAVAVEISTNLGAFTLEVYPQAAPLTANNFLAYLDGGYLGQGSFYRIPTPANETDREFPIEVLQFGWKWLDDGVGAPIAPIPLEPTGQTGLRHRKGTLSTARFAPDNGGYGFFVCMRDEPELDQGGRRHPDGEGFAAFGQILAGWETLEAILDRAEAQGMLTSPIPITGARRL